MLIERLCKLSRIFMRVTYITIVLLSVAIILKAQTKSEILNFQFEDVELNGILNLPDRVKPQGIVLIIHGSGKTNAVAQEWWYDVREAINEAGYATYMWDKMGCGKSGGVYNSNQNIQNSADEVVAAIKMLQETKAEGADQIGLWGISRAGWINPMVINQYENIAFWISVSGVDDDETFKYLLTKNLTIIGHPQDTVELLVSEWHKGVLVAYNGENYKNYLAATPNLRKNEFWKRITNGGVSEIDYYGYQKVITETNLDEVSDLPLYVADFENMLCTIDIPVLAIFGEKDMHVDWKQTKALYEKTLQPTKNLTIRTFPNANHNLHQCETGGFYEFEDHNLPYKRAEGFTDVITSWLKALK